MTTKTDRFDSILSPEHLLDGFEALVAEKGWELLDRSNNWATARKPMDHRTWEDRIALSAVSLAEGGTRVHVVVNSGQFVDRGSSSDVAVAIRERLASWGQHPSYQNFGGPPSGGQYPGYQNAPAPPTGYGGGGGGMPPSSPGWGARPPQQAVWRPATITWAIYALAVNLVLGLISFVLISVNRGAYTEDALRDAGLDPTTAELSADFADSVYFANAEYRLGFIIGMVIFVVLWTTFLWFAWKGQNWARIAIWVLGGLSLLRVFISMSNSTSDIVEVLNALGLLLILAAVVLLALKPSNEWYAYQANARRYGWSGRA